MKIMFENTLRIMLHFIWAFTVCKNTPLGVSRIQRVNIGFIVCMKNSVSADLDLPFSKKGREFSKRDVQSCCLILLDYIV